MDCVNISCGGYSVATRCQIMVYTKVSFNIERLTQELCKRLREISKGDATMIRPGDTYCTYIVTYADEKLREPVLKALTEIEQDVLKAMGFERLRRLVKNG